MKSDWHRRMARVYLKRAGRWYSLTPGLAENMFQKLNAGGTWELEVFGDWIKRAPARSAYRNGCVLAHDPFVGTNELMDAWRQFSAWKACRGPEAVAA